jgi:bifunctional DNA-binding transcriptional regulator/antitoxin component of YhaV-PrlF toxin-antitoxin module
MGFVEMNESVPAPYLTRIDSRGRITVRKEHREFMGLQRGGPIEWFVDQEGHACFKKAEGKKLK